MIIRDVQPPPPPLSLVIVLLIFNVCCPYTTILTCPHNVAVSPFYNLEKATVLQGCRVFHDSSVVTHEPARCCQLITNLLYLMNKVKKHTKRFIVGHVRLVVVLLKTNCVFSSSLITLHMIISLESMQGETLSSTEVTDVFFGVTKLFQSHEPSLRRMVYLFIKEVAATTNPDDVIIVTAPLTKDMNSPVDLYK